jgi:ribosomal protein S18 acetylase RimI-like enzyme
MTADDAVAVADLWVRTARAAYPWLPRQQALSDAEGRAVALEHVLPPLEVHLVEVDGVVAGFLGLDGDLIDRLYVDPAHQGRGLGTRLLDVARARHPAGLRLFTHQRNVGARRLYEREGFVAVRFGVSPPPENEPDVEYAWRPAAAPATTVSS